MSQNMFGDEEISANAFGDEEVQVEKPGFFTSVKRGAKGMLSGLEARQAEKHSGTIGLLDRLEREGDSAEMQERSLTDLDFRVHYEQWKLNKQDPAVLKQAREAELARIGKNTGNIEQRAQEMQLLPEDPATKKFNEQKTFGGAARAFAEAPLTVGKEVVAQSLGTNALTLPLTAASGLAGGAAGLAFGSGAGSFSVEDSSATLELLQQSGVDLRDPAAVAQFMNSPEFKLAKSDKVKKAAVIGAMDAATAGLAGKALSASPLKNIAAQSAVQMAGGGAGEALGSVAAGEEINPPAVLSEMIGEIPGGAMDVGTLAARKVLAAKPLNHVGKELELEAVTGMNSAQAQAVEVVTGAAAKPKLTPLQSQIVLAAAEQGVDPKTALAIAAIESEVNPNAKNPQSSAHGLFQLIDSTWEGVGGGDRNDVGTQITNGLRSISQTTAALARELGTAPSGEEVYLGHVFGPKGGAAAIRAAQNDPQGSFLETVKKWDPKNAETIVAGNALSGLTNEQAVNKLAGRFTRKNMALGGDDAQNQSTRAKRDMPPVEDVTGETQAALEAGLEDLDAMFAELEEAKLTPEVIQAAELEQSMEAGPQVAAEAQVLNGSQPEAVVTNEVAPAEVIDRQALYRDFTKTNGKIDLTAASKAVSARIEQALADGQAVNMYLEGKPREIVGVERGMPKDAEGKRWGLMALMQPLPGDNARIEIGSGELARAESWVSIDENRGRSNYENPNDLYRGKVHKAPIVAGADGFEGYTLEDRPLKPGEVIALGVDSEHTPQDVMVATQEALQEVVSRYAPSARVALTFQTEAADVVSSFSEPGPRAGYGVKNKQSRAAGLYRINMRNLTNFGKTDSGSRNSTTQRKFTYGLYHEAGHVIVAEQMLRGMSPELRTKFENMGRDDYFTPEELATLSPQQAAVLQEYNGLKWKVLNDPAFTAEEFAYSWLSPWKLSHGLGYANQPGLFSFAKKFLGEAVAQKLKGPARNLALAMEASVPDVLSPHEYMAEQFARYAYSNKLAEGTSLFSYQFFRQALEAVRSFFQQLKRGGEIKPGVAFAEWVDSLTATSEFLGENKALPEETKAASAPKPRVRKKSVTKVAREKTLADAPSILPPSKVQPKEISKVASREYSADQTEALRLLATDLRFIAKEDPKKYDHYMQLIRNDRLDDFKADLAVYIDDDFVKERVRFDTDIPEEQEWREIEAGLEKIVPKRSGLSRWLPAGLARLRAAQWYTWTSRQLAAKYSDVAGIQMIDKLHTNFKAFKAQLELPGLEAAQKWAKLGKEQNGRMQKAMREEHALGEHIAELTQVNGTWRFVANERLAAFAAQRGLEPETVQVWLDVKNAHLTHMNTLRNVMLLKLKDRLRGKPATLQKKAAELNQLFEHIRSTPFIPQTRFGEFALHVKEPMADGSSKIVHVEFFESAIMRDEALEKLRKAAGPQRKVVAANYNLSSGILRTLPPQMLGTWADELHLTEDERKELRQIADAITMNPQLRKYSTQLAGITGANKDLHRNFAEFMWHNSGNIARVHYKEHFQKALLQVEAEKLAAGAEGEVQWHDELTEAVRFYKRRISHILNPVDEYQAVRTFVVVKQLWGQIRTALANLTALKDVWATAAAQQGMLRGTGKTLEASYKALADSLTRTGQRVMRQPVEGGQVFSADTKWALDQAYKDGLISETFAAQLGTIANVGVLGRLNMHETESIFRKVVWAGMLPQHLIETYVRRVSLITQYEFYRKQGLEQKEAYAKARRDTYLTQGDNTLSNRPAIATGKAANFLIYFGFLQNQIYLLSGAKERGRRFNEAWEKGQTAGMTREEARAKFYRTSWGGETVKIWMAYAALGGMMGMPGAEDLDNILELIAKKLFGTHFSLREYAYALAAEISENAAGFGIDLNPRSLVHGTFADFSLFGLLPAVDVSPSTGLGNAIPGLGGLGEAGQKNGNFLIEAMGPLGGVLKQFNDVFSDDPSMLKKMGFFMPNVLNGAAKTLAEWEHGVLAPSGGRITIDRETGTVRDLTTGEQLVRLMGFNPEIIAANREVHWMQRDVQLYWTTRRDGLVKQAFEAYGHNDREAIADVQEALREFNASAPPKLRISAKELRGALRRKAKAAAQTERGVQRSKRFRAEDAEIRSNVMGQFEGED